MEDIFIGALLLAIGFVVGMLVIFRLHQKAMFEYMDIIGQRLDSIVDVMIKNHADKRPSSTEGKTDV